jgi:iron complex outermembrane receptor protein
MPSGVPGHTAHSLRGRWPGLLSCFDSIMLCLNSVRMAPGVRSALAVACGLALLGAHSAWAEGDVGEAVVVTASRMPQALQSMPVGATVITAAQIQRSGVADANEAIRKLAGVAATSDLNNGREQVLDLRGFGATANQNLVVLIDGIRISENEITSARLTSIPLELIDRIEIVRGGASVLWGEGASSGVINVILKRGQGDVSSAKLSATVESFGGYETVASGQWGLGTTVLEASHKRVRSAGYRDNSAYKQDVSALGVQWADLGWHAGLRVVQEEQNSRLPGPLPLARFKTNPRASTSPQNYADHQETRYLANLGYQVGAWSLQVDAGRRERQPDYQYVNFGSPRVDGHSSQSQLTPRLSYTGPLLGAQATTLMGLDWQDWSFDKTGAVGLETGSQTNRAAFVHGDFSWPTQTRLSLGWREEHVRKVGDYPGNPDWFSAPVSYKRPDKLHAGEWGLSQTLLPGLDVYGRMASSYRLANVDENRQTPSLGALLPQQNSDRELGVKWAQGANSAALRVFRQKTRDEIVYISDLDANANTDPTQRTGAELEGQWSPTKSLTLTGTWQQLTARYRSGPNAGKQITQVAPHTATARLSYRVTDQQTLEVGAQYRAESRFAGDESNACQMRVPSATLIDARYAWTDRVWTAAIGASNLADSKGYNYGYSYNCGTPSVYPYAGRSMKLSLSRQF